ncbi:MAG: hypothetical protein HYU35_00760 [Parcubacteria group bacterium]|nr:hypothetical protein [Parcubacteria group bacterium]
MKNTVFSLLLASTLIAMLVVVTPAWAQSAAEDGLITCGRGEQACTVCDLFTTANNIINFVLFSLLTPLGAAMIMYGGAVLLTSGGSQQKKEQGKTILTNTVIGIFIAFAAWAIINTVLGTIANQNRVHLFWEEFPQCAGTATVGAGTGGAGGSLPSSPANTSATTGTGSGGAPSSFQTRSAGEQIASTPTTNTLLQDYRALGEATFSRRFWEQYLDSLSQIQNIPNKEAEENSITSAAFFQIDELANQLGTPDNQVTPAEKAKVYEFLMRFDIEEVASTQLYSGIVAGYNHTRREPTSWGLIPGITYRQVLLDGTVNHASTPFTEPQGITGPQTDMSTF